MARTGKIARLPHEIREELNTRLRNNQQSRPILKWLHALPAVKAILASEFKGHSITKQNVSEWKKGGFRDWLVRQDALDFIHNLEDEHALGDQALAGIFSEKLARWIAVQYAATATALSAEKDPRIKWSLLREFCSDVSRLRRGDLSAEHVRIKRDWLAFAQTNTAAKKEAEFWEWTKRPDIEKILHPPGTQGFSPEAILELEKACLLMDPSGPGPEIGERMREHREAEEEEARLRARMASKGSLLDPESLPSPSPEPAPESDSVQASPG